MAPDTAMEAPHPPEPAGDTGRGRGGGRIRLIRTGPPIPPLVGYTVAVASERRRHDVAGVIEATGARTVSVQAVRAFTPADDTELRAATARCLAAPVDDLLVTSAFGFRAWIRCAQRFGQADALVARFARARLLASNPRAADALRELDLHEIWSTAGSVTEDLFRYLMAQPQHGRRLVVQSDTLAVADLCQALRATGAEVIEAPTFRCEPPDYSNLLRRLADQVLNRLVDALVVIGPECATNALDQAAADRRLDALLNALASEVPALSPGPVSAWPLVARGVPVRVPARPYLDDLVRLLTAVVPAHSVRVDGERYRLEVRGQAVVLDGELIPVQPGPIAVLRVLARQPGRIHSVADIRQASPQWAGTDDHAIEMAVSRLRRALRRPDLVQTVMKRGYRLLG
jgi:uroporphyrinogen-III synthase